MGAVSELWAFRGLVANLAQRELRAKYKKSVLGWTWSLVSPLAILGVYSIVFGTFLRIGDAIPIAGNGHTQAFALYLFAALVVWNLFNAIVTGSMAALAGAGPLLNKVYFPPEATIVANVLVSLLQAAAEVAILIAVMVVVANVSWTFLLLPVVFALFVLFATGIGLVVAIANIYYRDIQYLVGIMLNVLFYATPIIYPLDLVRDQVGDSTFLRIVLWIIEANPITQFVQASRELVYELRVPSLGRWAYLVVVSLASVAIGWAVFQRRAALVSEEV